MREAVSLLSFYICLINLLFNVLKQLYLFNFLPYMAETLIINQNEDVYKDTFLTDYQEERHCHCWVNLSAGNNT